MNLVLMLFLGITNFVYAGVVLAMLWSWFLLPLGVPNVGFVNAMGIMCMVTIFQLRTSLSRNGGIEVDSTTLLAYTFGVTVMLGTGFILKHFM